jgi:hypothetical protein
MSSSEGEIEFRNREEEIECLLDRLPSRSSSSSITFVRAPAGFGKSRLVDAAVRKVADSGLVCCVVEPDVRSRGRSDRVYSWFFVQRAAVPGAIVNERRPGDFGTFSAYLRSLKIRKIHWRSLYESGKEGLSIAKTGKIVIELFENWFSRNRFHPEALLRDDSAYATNLAREYVEKFASHKPTLFVVREGQLIDLESFRFFLNLHKTTSNVHVIFEYTHAESRFFPEHEKIMDDSLSHDMNVRIVDLMQLDKRQFLYLLKKYVDDDINLNSDFVLKWDGNLRLIRELKYRIYIDRSLTHERAIRALPENVRNAIDDHLQQIPNLSKLILAIVVCHVEAVPAAVLQVAIGQCEKAASNDDIASAIDGLIGSSGYLLSDHSRFSISDEDVQFVVRTTDSFARYRAMAERVLRDIYREVVAGERRLSIPLPLAFRQSVALCLRTGDVVALRRLLQTLQTGARDAHDQSLYIGMVVDAILHGNDANLASHTELIEWAAEAAYQISDCAIAAQLIEELPSRKPYHESLLGFCYGEINRHQNALEIGARLEALGGSDNAELSLAGSLIRLVNLFAVGKKSEAALVHSRLRYAKGLEISPLFGFVLRFTELIHNFPDCTADVIQSISHFEAHGLTASAAYSSLSAAMHLAYAGDTLGAKRLLGAAGQQLKREVYDRHILLNNEVVAELLSDGPDVATCLRKLDDAAYTVRDEFYRLVIENNRLICYWVQGQTKDALDRIAQIEKILSAPGFGNRDIFLTASYNVWAFLKEIGREDEAKMFLDRFASVQVAALDYSDYWEFRFGRTTSVNPKYNHLLKFKYHPEYLSHWLVDLDAMRDLREV